MSTESDIESRRIVLHLQNSDEGYREPAHRPNGSVDYFSQFKDIEKHLNTRVHPHVNAGATGQDGSWLTDHGPEHIQTVIRRIEDLTLIGNRFVTSPYETYLLLVAAHIHDLGNAFGREGHERKASEVLFGMEQAIAGSDTVEKRLIRDIAQAHGGKGPDGSKDTIGTLQGPPTIKKLAAILRLADEIAEERTRTSEFSMDVMEQGCELKKDSEVFHVYASRLNPIKVNHIDRSIELHFEVLKEHLSKKFWKNQKKVYLLDEIYGRTLKTHTEQIYCMKFVIPEIVLERTRVLVEVCSEGYEYVVAELKYSIEQTGYPEHIADITKYVPALGQVTGKELVPRLEEIFASRTDGAKNIINMMS